MTSTISGIPLYSFESKGTYKIFLKPKKINHGNLGVLNFVRMLSADKRHHELFDKDIGNPKSDNSFSFSSKSTSGPNSYRKYVINNSSTLFNIVCGNKKKVTFTYCYKSDGRLYLCRTTGKKDDDKCKHAWLCNKLYGIVSAGIMMFSKEAGGKIYIDNMSGTYKTPVPNLGIIKADFENSLPGLRIELLKSPNTNNNTKKKYCSVMTPDSVDYELLCPSARTNTSSLNKKQKVGKSKKNKTVKRHHKKTS
jgi:hypothetical protein